MPSSASGRRAIALLGPLFPLRPSGLTGEETRRQLSGIYPFLLPAAPPFLPGLSRSAVKSIGVWRIETLRTGIPSASIGVRELKRLETKLPFASFDLTTYPFAGEDVEGEPIPIIIGKVRGVRAFLINSSTKRFKVCGHSLLSFDAFYDGKHNFFIPDSYNLSTGEFTYSAWDSEGNEEDRSLFCDVTAEGENPVDCVKILLSSTTKGIGLPLSKLDTSSTGKGFGTNGARLSFVYGYKNHDGHATSEEATTFPIGLYLNEAKEALTWVQKVLTASFAILYVNRAGLYQIRAWNPSPSNPLSEVLDEFLIGNPAVEYFGADLFTKVALTYDRAHGINSSRLSEKSSEELRLLRGLTTHSLLEEELPISSQFGADLWAGRTLQMRGRIRRVLSLETTQEFSELEPGDLVRVRSQKAGINEVWEVIEISTTPGASNTKIRLVDLRGFRDRPGFWVSSPTFPERLGGTPITAWDPAWTDEQKKWALENVGFWTDDYGYIDITDPDLSFRGSVWI